MDFKGFYYDNTEDKIKANGYPISKDLLERGYVQKNNIYGVPQYYVRPNKVYIYLEIAGKNYRYDIYQNIMAIHPDRRRISLKLVNNVIARIINGDIEIIFKDGKPYLIEKKSVKKAK